MSTREPMPLGEAMATAVALQRVLPLAERGSGMVRFTVSDFLHPVLPYRVWCEHTYLPPGKRRQRTDRWEGKGQTLAEAFHALADKLEAQKR